jgi:hypothetical protein
MTNADQAKAPSVSQFSRRAFSASSRASSLASADMRAPWKPSRPISSAALVSSLNQRFIGKALAGDSTNKAFKPRESMMPYVPFVQAEGKLINIAAKMFRARMVINTNDASFENRENTFDSVSGDVAAHELSRFMIDRFMLERQGVEAVICTSFIRVNCRTGFDLPNDCSLNRSLIRASAQTLARKCEGVKRIIPKCFT